MVIGLVFGWMALGRLKYDGWLFLASPFIVGLVAGIADTWEERRSCWSCMVTAMIPLWLIALLLLLLGKEGVICLGMAAVIAIPVGVFAGLLAFMIQRHRTVSGVSLGMGLLVPFAMMTGQGGPAHGVDTITTSITIEASPEVVWKYVTGFPKLTAPDELLFRAGIAYPLLTRIQGEGIGAARQCVLSTGTMTERVTAWEPGRLLRFEVLSTPPSMRELSPWPDVDPPHLHGFYVAKQGEFRLTTMPGGRTLVEGQSWYQHGLGPAVYWNLWTRYIGHSIHERVLKHIKALAEADSGSERVASAIGRKSDRLRLRVRE